MLESFGRSQVPEYKTWCEWLNLDADAVLVMPVEGNRSSGPLRAVINGDSVHPRMLHPGCIERLGGGARIHSVRLEGLPDWDTFELWAEPSEFSAPRTFPLLDGHRVMHTRRPSRELLSVVVEPDSPTAQALMDVLDQQWWDGQDTDVWLTSEADKPFAAQGRVTGGAAQLAVLPLDVRGFERVAVAVEMVVQIEASRPGYIIKPTVDLVAQLSTTRAYRSVELGTAPNMGAAGTTWRNEADGFAYVASHTLVLGGTGGPTATPDYVHEPVLPVGIAVRLAVTGNAWTASEFASGLSMRITVTGY